MQLGEVLRSVALLRSWGLRHRWIETEITEQAGNSSAATGAEHPNRRAGVQLPIACLNPQSTCCCLRGSRASAGRTGRLVLSVFYGLVDGGMRLS